MADNKNLLIIFQKNLKYGTVKTRLAESIGQDKAMKVYRLLIKKTCEVSRDVNAQKWVFYSDYIEEKDIWTSENIDKKVQSGSDLGYRMLNAFKNGFKEGFERITIIGTDCYDILPSIIQSSFEKLNEYDYVIGPAIDGGYYLLGMKKMEKSLFINKSWSSSLLLNETLKDIESMNSRYTLLTPLNDVDTIEDLSSIKELRKINWYE